MDWIKISEPGQDAPPKETMERLSPTQRPTVIVSALEADAQ